MVYSFVRITKTLPTKDTLWIITGWNKIVKIIFYFFAQNIKKVLEMGFMKRLVMYLSVVAMVFFVGATIAWAEQIAEPKVEATGAVLVESGSGRVLWSKNKDEQMSMASTTKIMTAIITLEKASSLDEIVTVSKRAASAPKVKMFLDAGEEIRLDVLLYALMLQSSNDAAVAIAEHIGGTVEDFCAAMTTKAHELGAINTSFKTPSGLDAEGHYSTPHDMAIIAAYALQNPKFVEIINTSNYNAVSNKRTYSIVNKNRLLNEFGGAYGVKTGFTNKAGHCFVGVAQKDGMHLISVVLASGWGDKGREQKWIDTKQLLNYGFENFEIQQIVNQGDAAGILQITRTRTPQIGLFYNGELEMAVRKDGEDISVIPFFPEALPAPIEANIQIGEGRIYIQGEYFSSIPIYTAGSAERHDLKTSLEKVARAFLRLGTEQEIKVVLPEF